jgi:16S rRNA G966 N2-methylase RsmD
VVCLYWVSREKAVRLAHSPRLRKLRKVPELSSGKEGSRNIAIHADNLQALATLTLNLRGRVNLVFLDPPYNATRER